MDSCLTFACAKIDDPMSKLYDFSAKTLQGQIFEFKEKLPGKVVLIVNVASKCGLTPQYRGLEDLYRKYKDQGLVILGFPCNQFMGQEPGSPEQISEFCNTKYNVSFQLMEKIEVNGAGTHPIYEYLKAAKKPENPSFIWKILGKTEDIKWNFEKFLINKKGEVANRYAPTTAPEGLESDIKRLIDEE